MQFLIKDKTNKGDPHKLVRRWALFIAMLLSGGMLLLPRPPLLILLFILSLVALSFRGVLLRRTSYVWLLIAVVLIAAVIRPGPFDIGSLIIRYANFLGALLLLSVYLRSEKFALLFDLYAILPWMGIQAICTFALANLLPFIFIKVNAGDFQFSTVLFIFNYHEIIQGYSGLKRPNGFFYEPGVFQIYLNIYLYLSLFIFKNRFHIVIATIAVFCTLSTTGLVIALILWSISLLHRAFTSKGVQKKILTVLLMVALAPSLGLIAYYNIEEKISGDMQGSTMARQYDLYTGLNIIDKYPLLGIGFDHNQYRALSPYAAFTETLLSDESAANRSTSNGFIYLFYTIGIPLGLVFVYGAIQQKLFPYRFIFFSIISFSLLSEALIYTPFMLLIIFSGLCKFPRISALRLSLKGAG